jgi:aldehyde dehydrogenase (NAD+)
MESILKELGISKTNPGVSTGLNWIKAKGSKIDSFSPVDGGLIAGVTAADKDSYEIVVKKAAEAFTEWRQWPAPKRGEIVRQIGNELRKNKTSLGKLVSYEMGKSLQEGMGEVQEMIDICDFAVGLSRQLHGFTMHSERPGHRMYEQYHPLGIVAIISAFNFPVAVWSWNSMLAWVCGDVCIWKPSEKTPLCGIACHKIVQKIFKENKVPEGVCNLISGGREVGEWMSNDARIALVSATGSTRMGKAVGAAVGQRLGRSLLELGGNNATNTRRLIIHEKIYGKVKDLLANAYAQLKIGNPLLEKNHVGPLIDKAAVDMYLQAIQACKEQGGNFVVEGGVLRGRGYESGCYVKPCIAEAKNNFNIVQHETFAPILYIMKYKTMDEAIAMQNGVPQGLSSSIISNNLRETELFLSQAGSDCGIANVNIGTSGAEIGGAFGGEKETGGGRESGSDAWKVYMRRQTNTINYTDKLPLAQGIRFDL